MANKRAVAINSSALGAIQAGLSILEELRDECQEVVDALEEKFSGTSRYDTMTTTVDALSFVDEGEPDLDDEDAANFPVSYTEDQRKRLSRSARRDNAVNMLQAGADGLREWAENERAEHDDDSDWSDEHAAQAEEAADTIEEWVDAAGGAEFPGMMG